MSTVSTMSTLDDRLLGRIGGIYFHAQFCFGEGLAEAPPARQKRARRWIVRHYAQAIDAFPEGIAAHFAPHESDAAVLAFLQEGYNEMMRRIHARQTRIDALCRTLPEEVGAALSALLQADEWASVTQTDAGLDIVLDNAACFRRTLRLTNVEGAPFGMTQFELFATDLTSAETGLCLHGSLTDPQDESERPIAFTFAGSECAVEVYRPDCSELLENPWEHLSRLALAICEKSVLPNAPLNPQEQALVPLLAELARIAYAPELPQALRDTAFPQLTALAQSHGYTALPPLLAALAAKEPDSTQYEAAAKRLIATLCEQTCEPLWRTIFEQVTASQAGYPSRAEGLLATTLQQTRATVQRLMEQHGYTGTYPDFVKEGTLRGVHLAESYDVSYFIGMEKRAVSHIHVFETMGREGLSLQFLCGTALLRRNEMADDVYACLFNAKGRRLFCHLHFDEETIANDLAACVAIAAKKAELRRLTKAERQMYATFQEPWLVPFLSFLLIGGGLFGLFMTAGFMLIEFLVTLLFGQIAAFPALFMDTPWWLILLGCWVGFGVPMGLITVLAKRK